jgi:hypothetical protein
MNTWCIALGNPEEGARPEHPVLLRESRLEAFQRRPRPSHVAQLQIVLDEVGMSVVGFAGSKRPEVATSFPALIRGF